jgi:hypothetical protein
MDTDYWKQFIHERFLTPTFDEQNFLRRGALSLFVQPNDRKHTSFAQHIAAEELVSEFKEGKGVKTSWNKISENNHWLRRNIHGSGCGECPWHLSPISNSRTSQWSRSVTTSESRT